MITFTGSSATVSGLEADVDVCVQYNSHNDGMECFTISSSIIPNEVHMIQRYPLFSAGTDVNNLTASSQVGELIVDIPRFQFAGNVELSLSSSGAATSALSGSALAVYTTANCKDMGVYGEVKLNLFGGNWYDKLIAMAVDGADIDLAQSATKTLKVIGIYENGTGIISNANLTFTSDATSIAQVGSHTGVVTAQTTAGTANIEIVATDKPAIACYASVTVASS